MVNDILKGKIYAKKKKMAERETSLVGGGGVIIWSLNFFYNLKIHKYVQHTWLVALNKYLVAVIPKVRYPYLLIKLLG
jgi:hypothetical protein